MEMFYRPHKGSDKHTCRNKVLLAFVYDHEHLMARARLKSIDAKERPERRGSARRPTLEVCDDASSRDFATDRGGTYLAECFIIPGAVLMQRS